MPSEQTKKTLGMSAALACGLVAVVIAMVPVVAMVGFAKPVLDSLSRSHVALSASVAATKLPSKWASNYALPQYFQEDRGTCWDFATIGVLEQSYRENGIKKGFLKPENYVRLSEQAFGISMMEACRGHPDVCDVLGDEVYHNGTSGGEIWWLYSLTSLYNKVMPASICPYTTEDKQHECPGLEEALKTNPIKFDIRSMETAYNAHESKALMIAHSAPLAWTSLVHTAAYYMPCNDSYWSKQAGCSEASRVRCPTDRCYNSEWCARFESAMYDMDGEFMLHGNVVLAGGHGMNAVGYNDEFVTRQGVKGGFIIKNSWHDQTYGTAPTGRGSRGSHSIKYWMQDISAWDEKVLCPAPLNPDNWLSCVAQQPGPTKRVQRRMANAARTGDGAPYGEDLDRTCLSPSFMQYLVNVTLQPTEFTCLSADWCSMDAAVRYFLVSTERSVEQDLMKICMMQYNSTDGSKDTICTPYVNPSLIAYMWAPIKEQQDRLQNDLDFCGYYFWPYEVIDKQAGMYQNFFTTYFDLVWDDMSYAANADKHPDRDYSWVKAATGTQKQVSFGALPSPFPKKRY